MWIVRSSVSAVLLIGAALGGVPSAPAAEPEAKSPSQQDRIEELDQKVRILERRWEVDQENAAKAKESPVLGAGKDGFFLKSWDGAYQFKLRGYLQSDARFYLSDDKKTSTDSLLLRRVRPSFEGTVAKSFDFRILSDFGEGKAVLQEAYLDAAINPALRLRAGKFKTPAGLERLQSGTDLIFVERGFPTSILPNRDVGLQLSGDLLNGSVNLALGAFNGVPDGASGDGDTNDEKDLAARIFAFPFKNTEVWSLQGLGIGGSVTYGNQQGKPDSPNLPSFKSPGQQTFFTYAADKDKTSAGTVVAAGTRTRYSPQGYFYKGPLGVLAEYAASAQKVKKGDKRANLKNDAFQVVASYVLTGDDASFKGVKVKRPFESGGGWGALELATRYGFLRADTDAFPDYAQSAKSARTAIAVGSGLNWHLNKNIKVSLDYEQTRFSQGGQDREAEKIVLNRFQVAF
ncbi:MAG: porin [Nitrospirae bacterium]|nr:porin [Nitrospirota bacterium]